MMFNLTRKPQFVKKKKNLICKNDQRFYFESNTLYFLKICSSDFEKLVILEILLFDS